MPDNSWHEWVYAFMFGVAALMIGVGQLKVRRQERKEEKRLAEIAIKEAAENTNVDTYYKSNLNISHSVSQLEKEIK